MVLKLFTTFIVVAAILASPKHRDFTWSYRSSIYRVHCLKQLAKSLLMTNFDNELATELSSTCCCKSCERILISACCNKLLQVVNRLVTTCTFLALCRHYHRHHFKLHSCHHHNCYPNHHHHYHMTYYHMTHHHCQIVFTLSHNSK